MHLKGSNTILDPDIKPQNPMLNCDIRVISPSGGFQVWFKIHLYWRRTKALISADSNDHVLAVDLETLHCSAVEKIAAALSHHSIISLGCYLASVQNSLVDCDLLSPH